MWILQENLISDKQVCAFEDVFVKHSIPFETIYVIPFVDEIKVISSDPIKIPYGSTSLSTYAYREKWSGVFFNENFRTSVWIDKRDDMLNSDASFFTVNEDSEIMSMLLKIENTEWFTEWFVRPDNDLKEFSGFCCKTSEFVDWMDRLSGANGNLLNDDTKIAISSVKKIRAEWRWFIVGGELIDGSIYKIGRRLVKKHEDDIPTIVEAQALADIWLPHETCVMDTALLENGDIKVIEFNCFNCSGIYDNDVEKIILAVSRRYNV